MFGSREIIAGREARIVTFTLGIAGTKVRYSAWIDIKRHLIMREGMVARGHFMITENYDFNRPVHIPVSP